MNFTNFISNRILKSKSHRFSKPIVTISIISIALGVCVLILVFAITTGFRSEIQNKVIGFGSHIEISYFDNNESYQKIPIYKNSSFVTQIKQMPNVKNIQVYASKAGILKTKDEIEGIVLKGIDVDYDHSFFSKHLVKGEIIKLRDSTIVNDILISEITAKRLHLDTGSKLIIYFVQDPPRQRVFIVKGIYKTDMASFDERYAVCDLKIIQKLNDWNRDQIDGFEINVFDFNKLDITNDEINDLIPCNLNAQTIVSRNKSLIDWIGLFDQNMSVLLLLIIIVICISVISTQLTLILEQISTIGILKTLGCNHRNIRNIFLHISTLILIKGLLIGNAVGLFLCFIQNQWHIITLNPQNYYMSYVPIEIIGSHLLIINGLVVIVSLSVLIIPAYFVTRKIQIVDAIRYE